MDWFPLYNSLRIAAISTVFIFFAGIFAAYYIAKIPRLCKGILDVILTMPLVLPPTVVGYLILRVIGPKRVVGAWLLSHFGVKLAMTWWSAILATIVLIFPLMYRTARGAFEAFDETLAQAGKTLGQSTMVGGQSQDPLLSQETDASAGDTPLIPQEEGWRLAGEVLNTYIIVERGDTVYLIDKHAAHERMNFDRMKASGYDPMAQSLLAPAICRLSAQEREVLLAHGALLEEFGFEVDQLGQDLAVRQAPFDVAVEDIPATLEEIAQKLLTTGGADPAAARDELLHTMACKAAIKGGWKTSLQELERVAQAVMEGSVKYCPHGRPVAIELTKKELEKQFKRA